MTIGELTNELEKFQDLAPDMQVSTMLVFLFVAQRGSCNQKDI